MIEKKRTRRAPAHYVNNRDFSDAIVDYCTIVLQYKERGKEPPDIPEYIGSCFLKIAEGLSHKPNFYNYTYREEMVMDAVENCVKAIHNYDVEKATRGGSPNAFGYFTQISWFAFLRRIAKEKKEQETRTRYIESCGYDSFVNNESEHDGSSIMQQMKSRLDFDND